MAEAQRVAGASDSLVDHVEPGERWDFDESVTAAFDDMLARSIPLYRIMRSAVAAVARPFVTDGSLVVDLGTSRGEALASVIGETRCRALAVEQSPPMLEAASRRFREDQRVTVVPMDLRQGYPLQAHASALGVQADLTLAVLTLQFIPLEHRQRVVADAYATTKPGGALVVVEKVTGEGHRLFSLFKDAYHALKRENGYSDEQIMRKALSLENVLVPLSAAGNVALLRAAGFSAVDCFWRWMNFAGWIALR